MKKLFTIFGNPVSHSRSPLMHNAVFKHLNYDATYIRTRLEDGSLCLILDYEKFLADAIPQAMVDVFEDTKNLLI